MTANVFCSGVERTFSADEIIVSKTDKVGKILYANDTLLKISGFTEDELLGKPHNILRHPHMPAAIFKKLWDTIKSGDEISAYIINRCKNGDHYWVYAHVTPNFDPSGDITGFHSCRRVANPAAIRLVEPFYRKLREAELGADRQAGLRRSEAMVADWVKESGFDTYQHLVCRLGR